MMHPSHGSVRGTSTALRGKSSNACRRQKKSRSSVATARPARQPSAHQPLSLDHPGMLAAIPGRKLPIAGGPIGMVALKSRALSPAAWLLRGCAREVARSLA
jgi:hypothetical protein